MCQSLCEAFSIQRHVMTPWCCLCHRAEYYKPCVRYIFPEVKVTQKLSADGAIESAATCRDHSNIVQGRTESEPQRTTTFKVLYIRELPRPGFSKLNAISSLSTTFPLFKSSVGWESSDLSLVMCPLVSESVA
jgi:hypothetical protein